MYFAIVLCFLQNQAARERLVLDIDWLIQQLIALNRCYNRRHGASSPSTLTGLAAQKMETWKNTACDRAGPV